MNTHPSSLSDADLLATTRLAAKNERGTITDLVARLAEVEARRLYLGEGYNSMFMYCTRALHLSEDAAYARIKTARAARRFPSILDRLADGRLSLTTVGLLAPHLTEEHGQALFDAAAHQSKRDVERLIASLHPQPDIPATIRALPMKDAAPAAAQDVMLPTHAETPAPAATQATSTSHAAPAAPSVMKSATVRSIIAPLAPRRYLLRVTVGEETQRKLERARALLRHQIPDGDPAAILDRALTLLVAQAERTKFAATQRKATTRPARTPDSTTRRIPAAVRREVWSRDEGRCKFAGQAARCGETGFLEFHHVVPVAARGPSTTENIELRCRAHNQHEAERAGLTRSSSQRTRSGPASFKNQLT